MSQAQNFKSMVVEVSKNDPKSALEIALAETERLKAEAEKASVEYRAMAEIEFGDDGKIAKANMSGLWQLASVYSRSTIVPEQYRGKPADCFIAIQMAQRLSMDPMAYMQNSYVVYGRPGIETKLATALLNRSGLISGRINYVFDGEGATRSCTAWVIDAASGERCSQRIDWKMVQAEGWDKDKKGYPSKWVTMPDIMFQYRAAIFLIRAYYSDVLLGLYTTDELEDIAVGRAEEAPVAPVAVEKPVRTKILNAAIADALETSYQAEKQEASDEPENSDKPVDTKETKETKEEKKEEQEEKKQASQGQLLDDPLFEFLDQTKAELSLAQLVSDVTRICIDRKAKTGTLPAENVSEALSAIDKMARERTQELRTLKSKK